MVGMKIQRCTDKLFGNALCTNHAAFTLAIMFVMDLVLFFLDTFLWYIIWKTVFSIGRSLLLGLSIWTPWKDIYTRLPKRIYAKLLSTSVMQVRYKPKVDVWQLAVEGSIGLNSMNRCWSPRSGMLSSSQCIRSTSFLSNTSRSCSTIKWRLAKVHGGVSRHRHFSFRRPIRASRANSSLLRARQSVGYHASLSH